MRKAALYCVLTLLVGLVIVAMVTSCGPAKIISETETVIEYRDTTIFRDSTIFVPLPVESHTTIAKDSSELQTSLAVSRAWVDSLGLHHSLENRRGNLPYIIQIPLRTITDKARTNHNGSIIVEKKVEKDLSLMQTVKIWCFWPLLILALFTYRKQFSTLIGKLYPIVTKLFGL